MQKLEKEVKILNIDIPKMREKLVNIGAKFVEEINQQIYIYDMPTFGSRFKEVTDLLEIRKPIYDDVALKKLKMLLEELEDLTIEEELDSFYKTYSLNNLVDLLNLPIEKIKNIINSNNFQNIINKQCLNPNKYIRLRKNNNNCELTVKFFIKKEKQNLQKVIETEISIENFEETNQILESMGFARRSYQEKKRYQYRYLDAELDIDEWPMLEPYMEIEADDKKKIEEIIEKLDLKNYEIVSINTEELYKRKGIDSRSMNELRFKEKVNK